MEDKKTTTTIVVHLKTRDALMNIKYSLNLKSLDEVLQYILNIIDERKG
jgi:hypothetical protein